MLFYHLYGLNLQSTFNIPVLPEISAPKAKPDITIQLITDGCIHDFVSEAVAQQAVAVQIERTDALVYLQNCGVYLIQGGCKIVIISTPNAPVEKICQALLGVVMAVLLYQRGLYILHGSTVAIGGTALAFLGDSGAGKSSTFATLLAQGFVGVVDDLTAIQLSSQGATVYAGVPKMKLSNEVANTLNLSDSSSQYDDESLFSFPSSQQSSSFSLSHLYILEYGSDFAIEPISRQQAIIEVLRYSGLKSILELRDRILFKQAARLANCVHVYRLKRPRNLQQLPKMAGLLKDHIRSTHSDHYHL